MEECLFRIEVDRESDPPVIRAEGDLDLLAREPLLSELRQRAAGTTVVDVSRARFIDAGMMGAFFEAAGWAHRRGGRLVVVDAQSPPRSLWHITGFADVCPVVRCREEAEAALRE